ncbi:MAG: MotA/TolQ/ExbB proton channel family protein [Selenomonadaceae bacterium]|nr:MotA/TolQ/ExbB proton channel family protein [Selenomonadaceae bacterium]MBR6888200.1 MotA/TolQ/ExbB proton channel family protein [Selenomonadaceae bacterium]
MYLLLISSIAVAAIGIERFRFYSYASHESEKFLSTLKDWFTRRQPEEILNLCNQESSSVGLVASAGVKAAVAGESVELALNVAYAEEAMRLRARLNYLSMIVTLAPLLGLLGTISGMIESFNIFSIQAGQPLAITGGIGEALIATATGLCVSIFALIVHTYFSQKLDENLTALDKAVNIVLAGVNVSYDESQQQSDESEGSFQ